MKTIRILAAVMILTSAPAAFAQASKPLLHEHELPLIAAPDFAASLDGGFSIAKGKWTPTDGVLHVLDLPEQKHIPVLHHKVGLAAAVIELEFRLNGRGNILVGCDATKHVGRVVVNGAGLSIAEDSVKPSHTLAKLPGVTKPDVWHRLRVEWRGDRMAARLNGKVLGAQHPYLATPKSRSWIAAGKSVQIRNLRISGVRTPAKP